MKSIYISLTLAVVLVHQVSCMQHADPSALKIAGVSVDSSEIEAVKNEIRKTVMGETEAYYKQDFNAWKKKFVDAAYFRQQGYWDGYTEKVRYYNGFDTLEVIKKMQFDQDKTIWKGSYEKVYNESFRIYGDAAWYSYEQNSFDGKTNEFLGKSIETRLLEKHDGEWKIAYLGFYYLPKQKT